MHSDGLTGMMTVQREADEQVASWIREIARWETAVVSPDMQSRLCCTRSERNLTLAFFPDGDPPNLVVTFDRPAETSYKYLDWVILFKMVSDGAVALARQGPIEQACAVWTPMLPFLFSVILPSWMDGPCKPQVDFESEKKFDLGSPFRTFARG